MVDIVSKASTHRKAIAQATLRVSAAPTIAAILNREVPKGDVFEMAKAAGLLAVKKTSDVIPDCHPLPIELARVSYEINELDIIIRMEVHTVYKTGVEVEAMHGASVVALTMYDMLKPLDKGISIGEIKLLEKTGGKSDFRLDSGEGLTAAILLISDSIYAEKKADKPGQLIKSCLSRYGVTTINYELLPDEPEQVRARFNKLAGTTDLLLLSGGTGLTQRDKTPETIKPLLDCEIPGIMEAVRMYGQQRTPYAMLSRSFAGLKNGSLVLALPGSTNGVKESLDALFPFVLHSFKMLKPAGKR
jgi:cyclic pyranopterin monophosphate synthase